MLETAAMLSVIENINLDRQAFIDHFSLWELQLFKECSRLRTFLLLKYNYLSLCENPGSHQPPAVLELTHSTTHIVS